MCVHGARVRHPQESGTRRSPPLRKPSLCHAPPRWQADGGVEHHLEHVLVLVHGTVWGERRHLSSLSAKAAARMVSICRCSCIEWGRAAASSLGKRRRLL